MVSKIRMLWEQYQFQLAGTPAANRRRLFLGLTGNSYALARERGMEGESTLMGMI